MRRVTWFLSLSALLVLGRCAATPSNRGVQGKAARVPTFSDADRHIADTAFRHYERSLLRSLEHGGAYTTAEDDLREALTAVHAAVRAGIQGLEATPPQEPSPLPSKRAADFGQALRTAILKEDEHGKMTYREGADTQCMAAWAGEASEILEVWETTPPTYRAAWRMLIRGLDAHIGCRFRVDAPVRSELVDETQAGFESSLALFPLFQIRPVVRAGSARLSRHVFLLLYATPLYLVEITLSWRRGDFGTFEAPYWFAQHDAHDHVEVFGGIRNDWPWVMHATEDGGLLPERGPELATQEPRQAAFAASSRPTDSLPASYSVSRGREHVNLSLAATQEAYGEEVSKVVSRRQARWHAFLENEASWLQADVNSLSSTQASHLHDAQHQAPLYLLPENATLSDYKRIIRKYGVDEGWVFENGQLTRYIAPSQSSQSESWTKHPIKLVNDLDEPAS